MPEASAALRDLQRPHVAGIETSRTRQMHCHQFYVKRRDRINAFFDIRSVSKTVLSLSPSIFGTRMRQAREAQGLPQDRLGVLVGLDEGSSSARMSRYETGIHEPPISMARRISEALKVPLAFLYCTDDAMADFILQYERLGPKDRKALKTWFDALG